MSTPDWNACLELLTRRCEQAIGEFLSEHPDETLAFVAINFDYLDGFFGFSFDTWANSVQIAQQTYHTATQARRTVLALSRGWEDARSYLLNPPPRDYNDDVGRFTYVNYREVVIPEIGEFYSTEPEDNTPDPEGHVFRLSWTVLDTIYLSNLFQAARTSSPFRLGFFVHESPLRMVVTHLLNWQEVSD
jgi:hypothetical protein